MPPEFGETTDTPGRGGVYVYVKGQLVVDDDDREAVLALLQEFYPDVGWSDIRPVALEELGMSTWRLPAGAPPVPELVDALHYDPRGSGLTVRPNHVLAYTSHPRLIPIGPPVPSNPNQAPALDVLQKINAVAAATAGVTLAAVGVLDTGVIPGILSSNRCSYGNADIDQPDRNNDGILDYSAGHGTFVAGVVLESSPDVRVVARRLQPKPQPGEPLHEGYTTDDELAAALTAWSQERNFRELRVLTLSIGGYTHGGVGLPATRRAIDLCLRTSPDLVFVAGAGNDNKSELFYPAAFDDVVAVGAIRRGADTRTCFSNFGWWVDACAQGVEVVSSYLHWQNKPMDPYPNAPAGCRNEVPASLPGPITFSGAAEWRGTSFSAPRVAAWIANRVATGQVSGRPVSGRQAVGELRDPNRQVQGLFAPVRNLGRVVRPPF